MNTKQGELEGAKLCERGDDRGRRRRRRVCSLFSSPSVDVSLKSNRGSCLARMRMLLILLRSSLLRPTPLTHGVGSGTQRGAYAHPHKEAETGRWVPFIKGRHTPHMAWHTYTGFTTQHTDTYVHIHWGAKWVYVYTLTLKCLYFYLPSRTPGVWIKTHPMSLGW